jgi:hypothetical protein
MILIKNIASDYPAPESTSYFSGNPDRIRLYSGSPEIPGTFCKIHNFMQKHSRLTVSKK